MVRHLSLASVAFLIACSDGAAPAPSSTSAAAPPSAVPYVPTARRTASATASAETEGSSVSVLGAELVKAGFAAPESVKAQEESFQKLYRDPEVAAALDGLVERVSTDAAIKPHVEDIMTQALKNERVVAEVKKLAAGAKDQSEIQSRLQKHVEASMSAKAVDDVVKAGLSAMLDAPEVEKALSSALANADLSAALRAAFDDPELAASEEAVSKRLNAADGADAYIAAWRDAASKSPTVQTSAKELGVAAFSSIADSKEMKAVFVGGLGADRTKTILATALADVLADPEVKKLVVDVFVAFLGDAKNEKAIAAAADLVLKHEKFQTRIKAAMVEVLSSKPGTLALQRAIAVAFEGETVSKAMKAYARAFLQAAPPT